MSGRDAAMSHLAEGFSLLQKYELYEDTEALHQGAAERVLENLGEDPHAPEIAAAFQALQEARRLIGFKSAVDGKRILLSDYFTGLAVRLVLPLRNPRLTEAICGQIKLIGTKAQHPLYMISTRQQYKQIDELCRGYLECNYKQ